MDDGPGDVRLSVCLSVCSFSFFSFVVYVFFSSGSDLVKCSLLHLPESGE